VFVGPHVAFVNDLYPRSPRMAEVRERYADKEQWLVRTVLERGCSVGANATILGGVRLGKYCLIAAGAVVTRDVAPFALMAGSPARRVGTVCRCGQRIADPASHASCPACASEGERAPAVSASGAS
jgi:UDP-2-acetamido-3-amino-2,3-dideoxy-glucuronate N-acetyltransferase